MCAQTLKIASYSRVSYDEDKERYESIINQKNIVKDYAKERFQNYEIIEYEDDNFSGYKFDRPAFTKMRNEIAEGNIDIVIAKDLSRIGRHNAKTLLFIEELEQIGVTVIAINDDLDTSQEQNNDLVGIKTWYNELYVKDISRKIRSTVQNKSKNGTWITNVPYGYVMMDYQKRDYRVDYISAQVVKRIYEMYVKGYGYKKIAGVLTKEGVPTPKTRQKQLWEEQGKTYVGDSNEAWNSASINHIIGNDFYIGTLRTNKYSRRGINGIDKQLPEDKQFVFEDFHESIIDKELFYKAKQVHDSRTKTKTFYRGNKKYDNDYSGLMKCGDCGAPMFSISNGKRKPAYYCGAYHNHGKSACTSHHILVSVLDELVKEYIKIVKENAGKIIDYLNSELDKTRKKQNQNENNNILQTLKKEEKKKKNELKVTMHQKVRDIMKNPESREYIEEMYSSMESDLNAKIISIKNQIEMEEQNKQNIKEITQVKKDVLKIFDDILSKEKLDKQDLMTIIDCMYVYEDRVTIKLKSNIENIINIGNSIGLKNEDVVIVQKNKNHNDRTFETNLELKDNKNNLKLDKEADSSNDIKDGCETHKVYKDKAKGEVCSNDVKEGDPLEIFTDKEGEVILKKYSPIGELSEFATEYAETLQIKIQ